MQVEGPGRRRGGHAGGGDGTEAWGPCRWRGRDRGVGAMQVEWDGGAGAKEHCRGFSAVVPAASAPSAGLHHGRASCLVLLDVCRAPAPVSRRWGRRGHRRSARRSPQTGPSTPTEVGSFCSLVRPCACCWGRLPGVGASLQALGQGAQLPRHRALLWPVMRQPSRSPGRHAAPLTPPTPPGWARLLPQGPRRRST